MTGWLAHRRRGGPPARPVATAARQARRLARAGWWASPPFLPVPDAAWLRFRLETQYGDPPHPPVAADVVTWLEWARPNRGSRQPDPPLAFAVP